jgi:hypothetical protein
MVVVGVIRLLLAKEDVRESVGVAGGEEVEEEEGEDAPDVRGDT